MVNTHANGDHCYGNELVGGAEIIASTAAAEEMSEVPPALLAALNGAEGELGDLFRSFFGEFDFAPITLTLPTRTFNGRLDLEVGGRSVELVEVGPAHTKGDALVVVPGRRHVYTGDILFIGGTPIVWAGPLSNWVAACDLILGLDVQAVVPGHGPVTDSARRGRCPGLPQLHRDRKQQPATRPGWTPGRRPGTSAGELAGTSFARLGEWGRISVNVEAVYRELDPGAPLSRRGRAVPAHGGSRARRVTALDGDVSVSRRWSAPAWPAGRGCRAPRPGWPPFWWRRTPTPRGRRPTAAGSTSCEASLSVVSRRWRR